MGMDIYAGLAAQLRLRRLRAGLTLEELAEAAGISVSFLAYLEANKKRPSLDTLARLAGALKVPVSGFFRENGGSGTVPEELKALDRLMKLLRGLSREDAGTVLAVVAALVKKLSRGRP
ncbi:MAG: helix-turn-helix transcriptional regulator [Elusimicrobia bacterium]|nr:helix-turn-helix transcriptional regulator [Elusimicrobiota bacterium]